FTRSRAAPTRTVPLVPKSRKGNHSIIFETRCMRALEGTFGPIFRHRLFPLWACLWQLPERVYLSAATGAIGGQTAISMSRLQSADRFLRQYSCSQLAAAARSLSTLSDTHIGALHHG